METPLLEVNKLTKHFGGLAAVQNVSFKINKGEVIGLVGPNGAGKTTVTRLIMGILKLTSGTVIFKGEDITGKSTAEIVNRGMATTFQVVKPFRNLPVIANVMVSVLSPRAKRHGDWVKSAETRAQNALEFCGISDLAREQASILSHGDLKRLELARALATEPELLILDEPFGGLNPAETSLIVKSLKRLHVGGRFGKLHSEGPSMLIVEHKLSDLIKLVDRIIVLKAGQKLMEGPPDVVMNDPIVIEAYIGRRASTLVS
ncbi:MAG: ABC transporter ATP-binding protein [Dehalococcoidia bacterium]|jgi:branched-chain amino acid transport system ATP-binding protein